MDAYATTTELDAFVGSTVTDGARLLDRASELMDSVVRMPYAVDDNGIPTNTDIAAALRDATCAQVEQWIEVDEHNAIDGLAGTKVSTSGHSGERAPEVAPRAIGFLQRAGLTILPGIQELGR